MGQSPHILVVDDQRDIRDLLARYLIRHGFRATAAESVAAARKVMQAVQIDLIVLDIMMPGEDGLSLTRSIRENHDIPVILLTAMGDETDRSVDNQVSRLRRKIERNPKNPSLIKTAWGGGYCFAGEVSRQ